MLVWLKNYKTEIGIFLLAFGVRFLYAIFVQFKFGAEGFLAYSDAFSFYLPLAKNIVENQVFSMSFAPPYIPDAYRTPLYPIFLAGFLWLKLPLFAVVFAQNVMAGIMAVLIYRIGVLIFSLPAGGRNIALFAAIFMSVEPMSVYWNNLLMSDYLFAFLFVSAFYCFLLKRYYLFALSFGLATLTRSVGVYFFPLFLIFMFWNNVGWKKIVLTALLFSAAIFPWMLRNKAVFDTWQLSTASWYNLYGVVTQMFAQKEGFILPRPQSLPYDPTSTQFYKEHFFKIVKEKPLAYTKFYISVVLESFFKNPYAYLSDYVLKLKLAGLSRGAPSAIIDLMSAAGWLAWMAVYVLAFFCWLVRGARPWFGLVLFLVVFNAFSVGALGLGADMSRYMLPLAPFVLLFAAAGFSFVYKKYVAG